jgi:hypothetical protein
MAHPLVDDVIFAFALAPWWQLRRSAYLLPHLRKGPSPVRHHPDAGVGSWIKAISAVSTPTTCRRAEPTRRSAADARDIGRAADVLDTVPMAVRPATPPRPPSHDAGVTTPTPVPVGLRQAPPPPWRQMPPPTVPMRRPPASIPRPRAAMEPPTPTSPRSSA